MDNSDSILRSAFRSAFSGEDGRKALAALRLFCYDGKDLFMESSCDRQLSYLEGRRSVIMEIDRIMEEPKDGEEEAE